MSKTVMLFGVVVFLIISWLIGFVDKLNDDVDVNYGFKEKTMVERDMRSYKLDSIGNEILELSTLTLIEKKKLWNQSPLKGEMIGLFPNFSDMKYFIESRIEDDSFFKKELLKHVESVQERYIGGGMTGNRAKLILSKF